MNSREVPQRLPCRPEATPLRGTEPWRSRCPADPNRRSGAGAGTGSRRPKSSWLLTRRMRWSRAMNFSWRLVSLTQRKTTVSTPIAAAEAGDSRLPGQTGSTAALDRRTKLQVQEGRWRRASRSGSVSLK